MAGVEVGRVSKSYGDLEVMRDISLKVGDGEVVVFVGPSGCGKSTLLRMIAGLEEISGGEIRIGGRVMNEVAPSKRGVAMVFQSYALYPHMTVYRNMAFGLKQAKTSSEEIDRRVRAAAEVLRITEFLERSPRALSGGQRQRVAIGRAIVREPEVFLFDEPLSNLDAALRVNTRLEIARLHGRLGATMIYVTHDQVEAMTLADRIVVLRDGRVEQIGTPIELYECPANMFVAQFIGSPKMNFFSPGVLLPTAPEGVRGLGGGNVVGVRPEHLRPCGEGEGLISGKLELVELLGEYALVHLLAEGGVELIVKMERPPSEAKGAMMNFSADESLVHIFDEATGKSSTIN